RRLAVLPEYTCVDGDVLTPGAGPVNKSGGRGRKQGGTAGGNPLVLAAEDVVRPSQLQRGGGTDGPLHNRDPRRAAPRDPGAPAPDRRGGRMHTGADGRRRRAA